KEPRRDGIEREDSPSPLPPFPESAVAPRPETEGRREEREGRAEPVRGRQPRPIRMPSTRERYPPEREPRPRIDAEDPKAERIRQEPEIPERSESETEPRRSEGGGDRGPERRGRRPASSSFRPGRERQPESRPREEEGSETRSSDPPRKDLRSPARKQKPGRPEGPPEETPRGSRSKRKEEGNEGKEGDPDGSRDRGSTRASSPGFRLDLGLSFGGPSPGPRSNRIAVAGNAGRREKPDEIAIGPVRTPARLLRVLRVHGTKKTLDRGRSGPNFRFENEKREKDARDSGSRGSDGTRAAFVRPCGCVSRHRVPQTADRGTGECNTSLSSLRDGFAERDPRFRPRDRVVAFARPRLRRRFHPGRSFGKISRRRRRSRTTRPPYDPPRRVGVRERPFAPSGSVRSRDAGRRRRPRMPSADRREASRSIASSRKERNPSPASLGLRFEAGIPASPARSVTIRAILGIGRASSSPSPSGTRGPRTPSRCFRRVRETERLWILAPEVFTPSLSTPASVSSHPCACHIPSLRLSPPIPASVSLASVHSSVCSTREFGTDAGNRVAGDPSVSGSRSSRSRLQKNARRHRVSIVPRGSTDGTAETSTGASATFRLVSSLGASRFALRDLRVSRDPDRRLRPPRSRSKRRTLDATPSSVVADRDPSTLAAPHGTNPRAATREGPFGRGAESPLAPAANRYEGTRPPSSVLRRNSSFVAADRRESPRLRDAIRRRRTFRVDRDSRIFGRRAFVAGFGGTNSVVVVATVPHARRSACDPPPRSMKSHDAPRFPPALAGRRRIQTRNSEPLPIHPSGNESIEKFANSDGRACRCIVVPGDGVFENVRPLEFGYEIASKDSRRVARFTGPAKKYTVGRCCRPDRDARREPIAFSRRSALPRTGDERFRLFRCGRSHFRRRGRLEEKTSRDSRSTPSYRFRFSPRAADLSADRERRRRGETPRRRTPTPSPLSRCATDRRRKDSASTSVVFSMVFAGNPRERMEESRESEREFVEVEGGGSRITYSSYASGCLLRNRLKPFRYSSTMYITVESTRRRYKHMVVFKPQLEPFHYFESVTTCPWTSSSQQESDEESEASTTTTSSFLSEVTVGMKSERDVDLTPFIEEASKSRA
ncbi:unnamed protein product, partial [Darwinula stevensoni]